MMITYHTGEYTVHPALRAARHGSGLDLLRDQQDGRDQPEYDWGCEDIFVSTHPVHMNSDSFCANLSQSLCVNLGPRVSRLHRRFF